jgi:predicted RNA-binding Zn ribbon-like protein
MRHHHFDYTSYMPLAGHPRDSLGLPLPDGSWPDQPRTSGGLDVVRRFCNSINREHGGDAWRSVGELCEWLAHEGYPTPRETAGDLRRARSARDAIHRAVSEQRPDALQTLLSGLRLEAAVVDGEIKLVAVKPGVETAIVSIVSAILRAQHDGTWPRLKACRHCQWIFYDHSKNRSGLWCTMQACGGRHKARAYRQRQGD